MVSTILTVPMMTREREREMSNTRWATRNFRPELYGMQHASKETAASFWFGADLKKCPKLAVINTLFIIFMNRVHGKYKNIVPLSIVVVSFAGCVGCCPISKKGGNKVTIGWQETMIVEVLEMVVVVFF